MIDVDIPGYGKLELNHLVLDYNGTLAVDGMLLPGVKAALNALAGSMTVHVVTADTFRARRRPVFAGVDCRLSVLAPGRQDQAQSRCGQKAGAGADGLYRQWSQRRIDARRGQARDRRDSGRGCQCGQPRCGGCGLYRHRQCAGTVHATASPHGDIAVLGYPPMPCIWSWTGMAPASPNWCRRALLRAAARNTSARSASVPP